VQLGFDAMPRKLIKVTPSRLSTWMDCPRRFRMAYLDRPTPPRGGAFAHSTLGAVVHNALRSFFDLPVRKRTPAAAAALVGQQWNDEGFAGPVQAATYREVAATWVADYVAGIDVTDDPIGLERWVSAPIGTIVAEGRVDRIDERDGELVIVDYKTGRSALTTDDARSSQRDGGGVGAHRGVAGQAPPAGGGGGRGVQPGDGYPQRRRRSGCVVPPASG
jgi:putative RecB family exonuclease